MAQNVLKPLSVRSRVRCVVCCCFLLIAGTTVAQEPAAEGAQESEYELLAKAEADSSQAFSFGCRDCLGFAIKAHKRLKGILQRNPESVYRLQILEDMKLMEELLGQHQLVIAVFYMEKSHAGAVRWKAAESRLLQIVNEYPAFSKMDEVLLRLGDIAARDKRVDDASRYLWTAVCNYPESKLSETVFSKLNQLGSSFAGCNNTTVQPPR